MSTRTLDHVVAGLPASDGAGVKLTRLIGQPRLDQVDPFLLLDEFRSDQPQDYLAGFPLHPHRGFETVTYMLAGRMRHQDTAGNHGLLEPGSVQWMTAGRGLQHSEMPEQENGLMWGFQLWVNLPAKDKMTAPRYQDIPASEIPEVRTDSGAKVRVIAGQFQNVTGPVQADSTAPVYLDVTLPAGTTIMVPLLPGHQGFVYPFVQDVRVGEAAAVLQRGHLGLLGEDGEVVSLGAGEKECRVLVVAGRPLREPVARYGPFVMNTREEIEQTFRDLAAKKF